jgi:transposase, IS5 family
MREIILRQTELTPAPIVHPHGRELAQISAILDGLPNAAALVHADLIRFGANARKGRKGMPAEQVLRALLVKQMNDFSYEQLAFHLADSTTYRSFCRIGIADKSPTKKRLQKNIKLVRAETIEAVNRMLVGYARDRAIEAGDRIRADTTVIETNIHHPTDSTLLWDCVRVLARLMADARDDFRLSFSDHRKRAKRRAMGILNAKSNEQRVPLYRELIKLAVKTVGYAQNVAEQLRALEPTDFMAMVRASALAQELKHYTHLAERVISQADRRVLQGISVPAEEKIVSIFEPHTDIIVKDRRDTLYGHKISIVAGASGLVTDVVVESGNPADSTLAVKLVERQRELYGRAPREAAFDGGFTSRANLTDLKALGVKDVAFSKRAGIEISEMVKSSWLYQRLRDFRAGIEGIISFLKRGFGLTRCTWRGLASFKAYVFGSVLAANLLTIARHLLAESN